MSEGKVLREFLGGGDGPDVNTTMFRERWLVSIILEEWLNQVEPLLGDSWPGWFRIDLSSIDWTLPVAVWDAQVGVLSDLFSNILIILCNYLSKET